MSDESDKKLKDPIEPIVLDESDTTNEHEKEAQQNAIAVSNAFDLITEQLKPEHFESLEKMYSKYTSYHYRHIREVKNKEIFLHIKIFALIAFLEEFILRGDNFFSFLKTLLASGLIVAVSLGAITLASKSLTGRIVWKYHLVYLLKMITGILILDLIKPFFLSFPSFGIEPMLLFNIATVILCAYLSYYFVISFAKTNFLKRFHALAALGCIGLMIVMMTSKEMEVEFLGKNETIVYSDKGIGEAKPISELNGMVDKLIENVK